MLAVLLTMLPARARAATIQVTFSPASLSYGNVTVGQSETFQSVLTNRGKTSITITSITSNNSEFSASSMNFPAVIGPSISIEVNVTFSPTLGGAQSGQISVAIKGSSTPAVLALSGTGVASVTASPASVSFGKVAVGAQSTLPVVLKNMSTAKVTLTGLQTTGSGFSVSGASLPLTLKGGQTVTLNATFKPSVAGQATGDAFVSGPALNVPLSGTGTGGGKLELSVAPSVLSFGNVAVGTTGTLTAGLNASGGSVTISSLSSSSSQFAVPGVTFPLTVPAGQEIMLNVTFTPKGDGNASGNLMFQSNAADSPTSEPLSGTGTAPFVSLSWTASSSQNVTGYNVYRSTSKPGSYARINSSLDPDTNFTDTTVAPGSTYYYATTSVNTNGQESSYSNQVKVVVP
jgi:hypothetical protein